MLNSAERLLAFKTPKASGNWVIGLARTLRAVQTGRSLRFKRSQHKTISSEAGAPVTHVHSKRAELAERRSRIRTVGREI
jgi:hypothetical protein